MISKRDVLIRKTEKIPPRTNASISSVVVTRNIGCKNMSAPVLIKIGGKIIFLAFVGFFDAFIRINMTTNAIMTAIIDVAITKVIHPFPHIRLCFNMTAHGSQHQSRAVRQMASR
jgi:hypothetical protein